ncbi:putative Ig domain-containing protein [Flavobacterium sp. W22_SRS_FP1]|uniref:putative Ig domain-containing protein n=1 Tax=Flavobacterium sp. W22_SRS_FP1 TaxID=3240276 RepID=UPI003F90D601
MVDFKKIVSVIVLLISSVAFSQKSISFPEAKFKKGDQPEWKNIDHDDSDWATIKTTLRWEEQGYIKYDGYAWYRIKFVVPSSFKSEAAAKEGLTFFLSRIDDADETYFNGVMIGKTGSFPIDTEGPVTAWGVNRVYKVDTNKVGINWDKENILAIRVSDFSGGGGVFGAVPTVRMNTLKDVLDMNIEADSIKKMDYHVVIKNTTQSVIEGIWTIYTKDGETNKIINTVNKPIQLKGQAQFEENIAVTDVSKRIEIVSSFKENESSEEKNVVCVTPYILTPASSDIPRINSPAVFGVRPNSPMLFKIAATGKGELIYKVKDLPRDLSLNSKTGIISGKISNKGNYKLSVVVSNKLGKAVQDFVIKVGDQIALTPPMGWNSWNCWGLSVSDEKVRSSAQAIIDKGLINHGWSFVNIDDGWESEKRNDDGTISSNKKFKDMKSMGDWLHDNGMKFGIYSSPGTKTCGDYLGSYQYEDKDAAIYSKWGVDYLKYDWCSYDDIFYQAKDSSLAAFQKPYKIMQKALLSQSRDIVYSLCQYGMADVWKWGGEVSGNSWRTTDDINDSWQSVKNTGFTQGKLYPYAKPGNWNDPDMLVVGQVGWSGKLRPSRLNPDEQYSHISLWCLLSAPLLIGCDINMLDDFTLNLLTNDEVIAVNQDVLGRQAQQKIKTDDTEIWVKDLDDGGKAIGIFNMSENYAKIQLNFAEIGLDNSFEIRDIWRQKDLGVFKNEFPTSIPPHGVTFIKLLRK